MLLVIILTIAGNVPAPAAEYRCVVCGQLITKQAAVVDGKLYHPECFRCASCNLPIEDEYLKGPDERYYHRACLERLKQVTCAYCKLPITQGNCTTFEGATYHPECYLKFIAPRCEICGEPLGKSFITDYWGNRFHHEHTQQYPVCPACGRLVWKGGIEIGDGKKLCEICSRVSVTTPEQARALLEQVREELATMGIVVKTLGLRIQLVDRQRLEAGRAAEGHSHAYAHVDWKGGTKNSGDETATVQVLAGLPDDMVDGIIAHELMHVWQHENAADTDSLALREGSANWASSLIYSRLHTKRGQFFLNSLEISQDPIYGKGYRDVAAYADQFGMDAVLRMLKGQE